MSAKAAVIWPTRRRADELSPLSASCKLLAEFPASDHANEYGKFIASVTPAKVDSESIEAGISERP